MLSNGFLSLTFWNNRLFLPDKPFQPSLMFAGTGGANKKEVPFKCSSSLGKDKHASLLRKFVEKP